MASTGALRNALRLGTRAMIGRPKSCSNSSMLRTRRSRRSISAARLSPRTSPSSTPRITLRFVFGFEALVGGVASCTSEISPVCRASSTSSASSCSCRRPIFGEVGSEAVRSSIRFASTAIFAFTFALLDLRWKLIVARA
jgi:hypothetical protein